MIKLSIIIPIYKVADFIAATVHSLLCQHDPAVEYIFVNDCSPDNSWQILQDTLQENPVDYLAIKLKLLPLGTTISPVKTNMRYKQLAAEKLFCSIISYQGKHSAVCNIVKRQLTVDHPMQKTGLKIAEDYVMHCCWSIFAESAVILENPVYGYVIRPQSAMNQSKNQDIMKATKQAFQKLSEFLKILPEKKQKLFCSKLQFTAAKMRMLFFIDILNNHDRSEFKELMQYQVEANYSLLKDIWKLPLELQPIMFCDRLKCYGIMRCYTSAARKLKRLFQKG